MNEYFLERNYLQSNLFTKNRFDIEKHLKWNFVHVKKINENIMDRSTADTLPRTIRLRTSFVITFAFVPSKYTILVSSQPHRNMSSGEKNQLRLLTAEVSEKKTYNIIIPCVYDLLTNGSPKRIATNKTFQWVKEEYIVIHTFAQRFLYYIVSD